MKRIFTILALAAAFSLAVPITSEAAPRKDKNKSSHVSKQSHRTSTVAARSGSRGSRHAVVTSSRHHNRGVVRGSHYRYAPRPVYGAVRAPAPYYCYPRRGLLSVLFRL